MDPINYSGFLAQGQQLVPDLAFRDLQMRLGELQTQRLATENQAAQAEMQRLSTAAQRQQQFSADAQEAFRGGPRAIAQLVARYPEFGDTVKGAWDRMDAGVRDADLRSATEIYSAASNGRYDIAAESLRRRIEADKAIDGQADPQDEAILAGLTSDDPEERRDASARVGAMLAAITGPDKFASTFGALREGEAGFTLSPGGRRFDKDGNLIAQAPFAPRTITVGEGQTVVEYDPNTGGGGPASGGSGASGGPGAPSGRTQFGWTPRARNGGDNPDADVDNKIAGMARNLGIDATTPFPADMSNLQIAKALALSEGGAGSLADRNNNPGNLRDPRTGAYRKFPTKEAGLLAAAAQVARNRARGQTTIATMVEGLPVSGRPGAGNGQPGGRVVARGAPKPVDTPKPRSGVLKPGTQMNGYVFKGGDPRNRASWQKVS